MSSTSAPDNSIDTAEQIILSYLRDDTLWLVLILAAAAIFCATLIGLVCFGIRKLCIKKEMTYDDDYGESIPDRSSAPSAPVVLENSSVTLTTDATSLRLHLDDSYVNSYDDTHSNVLVYSPSIK